MQGKQVYVNQSAMIQNQIVANTLRNEYQAYKAMRDTSKEKQEKKEQHIFISDYSELEELPEIEQTTLDDIDFI